jgi:hypothetical protein
MQIFVLFTSFSFHLIFQTMLTLRWDCDHYKIAKKESSFLGKKRKKIAELFFTLLLRACLIAWQILNTGLFL